MHLYETDGMLLSIQSNGSNLWRFRYRHLGRQKTLHNGSWPDVPLAFNATKRG